MLQQTGPLTGAPVSQDRTSAFAAHAEGQLNLAIANLRGVFILILLSFHACLAYLGSTAGPATRFDEAPYPWLAFPVVDDRRFYGFDLYCAWEDVHLMAMMFFLSGLFAPASLARKGAARFAADRVARLGAPFLVSVFVLIPIAVYPVFHRLNPSAGLADYLEAYRRLPFVPNGPQWFLWLLLAMTLGLAATYGAARRLMQKLSGAAADARRRPRRFLAALFGAAVLAYLPLALLYGPFDWFEGGLFSFQKSRPLLYFVYFLAGVAVGHVGLGAGLIAPDAVMVRHWRRLATLSPLFLFAWMGLTGVTLSFPAFAPLPLRTLAALAYVGASVAGVMLLLALATRFCERRIGWLQPLSRNSLGIFVLHYAPLVWTQYALSFVPIPAIIKAIVVFLATLLLSLGGAILIRRFEWTAWLIGEEPQQRRRAATSMQR